MQVDAGFEIGRGEVGGGGGGGGGGGELCNCDISYKYQCSLVTTTPSQ